MIDNTSLIKKVKLKQKAKFSQINKKNITKFQEPKEEPIHQIRNIESLAITNEEYNDKLNHHLQVELGDDIIINNQVHENYIDNLNSDERIKYLININKSEQIDFINTLLKLKGINFNNINNNKIIENENDNINLTRINQIYSNNKPDDESKSYIKEILDICDNSNNKNVNNNFLNNDINSISISLNNGKDNFNEINNNNIDSYNKNEKGNGLKTIDLIEIANKRKKMGVNKNYKSIKNEMRDNKKNYIKKKVKNENDNDIEKLIKEAKNINNNIMFKQLLNPGNTIHNYK